MRQKKLTTAAAVLLAGAAPAILWSSTESEAQTSSSEIACTQTPDCSTLGYTKTSSQCPDGGIKCPFDGNKMFCVSGDNLDYIFQNGVKLYDVAYADGTTSAAYNANKLAIGLVFHVHDNVEKNHAWLLSLEQFPASTRAEAIKRCAGFSTKGTRAGDWHLPDGGELLMMGKGNGSSDFYAGINNAIKKIPGAAQLGSSYNLHYCMSDAADKNKSYLNGSPTCSAITVSCSPFCPNNGTWQYSDDCNSSSGSSRAICSCPSHPATAIYTNTNYWSMSDQVGSSNYIYGDLNNAAGWGSAGSANAKYGHYRCVAHL